MVGDINKIIKEKGAAILSRNAINFADEFHDLDIFWNLLKDEGDNRQWEVEELLGRFVDQYDK